MPSKKTNQPDDQVGSLKINKSQKSSLSEFIERPLPSEQEVENFEEKIEEELKHQKETEVSDELLEIYEDSRGNIIDVKKINIKKRRGFVAAFFKNLFILAILAGLAYGAYSWYLKNRVGGSNLLDLTVTAPKEIMSGGEVLYDVNYKNLSKSNLRNLRIEVTYPENFIYIESLPQPSQNKNTWDINNLDPQSSGTIRVKGRIINQDQADNLLLVKANYLMDQFSTEFKKEASAVTTIKGLGFNVDFNYASTALIGEDNEIELVFSNYKNLPESFNMVFELPENISITSESITAKNRPEEAVTSLYFEKITDDTWRVSGFDSQLAQQKIVVNYKIKDKVADQQQIGVRFEQKADNNQNYTFLEKDLKLEIIKSSLNISLSINDNKGDQAVNFGDTLNYSLSYSNKGDSSMKDVVVMAVIDSEFVDFATLKDKNRGVRKKNIITWTKNEIPELKELEPNKEEVINFSLQISPFNQDDLGKNFQITSYAQFSIGNSEELKEGSDNKSNTIVNKINSNLGFVEEFRYFDEDNIPVGNGPLPPRVGEKTSWRVYWTVKNDLHELNDVQIDLPLPSYVVFNENSKASVGSLLYDVVTHKVTWIVGRLPVNVYQAQAEFSLALTPAEDDRNKIMVLANGATIQALDTETQSLINKKTAPQTTKLEDDDIASLSNDGRIQ